MASLPENSLTPQQYLAIERESETRSEYFAGEMFAMTGATRRHNLIAGNFYRLLGNQFLDRACEAYQSDMRVKVDATGLYTYPDVVAVCGEPLFEDQREDTLLNPQALVEVLSPSIEDYDRGRKFEHYRRIESLTEYVLVSQDRVHVELHVRQRGGQWLLTEFESPDRRITLESIGVEVRVSDLYHKVSFDDMNNTTGH